MIKANNFIFQNLDRFRLMSRNSGRLQRCSECPSTSSGFGSAPGVFFVLLYNLYTIEMTLDLYHSRKRSRHDQLRQLFLIPSNFYSIACM